MIKMDEKDEFGNFKIRIAKIRYSPHKILDQLKVDALNYLSQLELLRRGVSCRKKSMEECRKLVRNLDIICDSLKPADFSLHDFPRNLRGETSEVLVCLKLLEYDIRCRASEKSYEDRLAFPAFKVNPKMTPLQIKSMSLAKHGYEIHCDDTPLEKFDGWYIILIEHEPRDFLLFACSDRIKGRFMKNGYRPKKHGKIRPHIKRKFLTIPFDLSNDWSDYLDPTKFIKDVHRE